MSMALVKSESKKPSQKSKLTTINSSELKVLYDIFIALKQADENPCEFTAKRIKQTYLAAHRYYDNQ